MAQDKIQMPSSSGGLVRYFDDYKSKITISPITIIIFIVIVIIVELLLRAKIF
jgi:preprotein translocase subunit Sec61beta